MKKILCAVILVLMLLVAFAVFSSFFTKQETPPYEVLKTEAAVTSEAPIPMQELKEQKALLMALTEDKEAEKTLSDLSAFTKTPYGLIDLDYVLLFRASGNEALLSFAGSINDTVSGKFSATETHLTIGDKSYLYAFFNSYLLLQTEYGMHILYPSDAADFEAAYALLNVATEKLSFKNGKLSITLPDYAAKDAAFNLDKNKFVVAKSNWENLALGQKPSASSIESAENNLANVNDGNLSTRWSSTYQDNQWLKINLGSLQKVGAVRIYWETAAPKDFEIRLSKDGTNWDTVYTENNNKIQDGWGNYFFDAAEGQYLQVKCGKRLTTYGVSIYEIEAYEEYVLPKSYTYGIKDREVFLSDGVNTYYFESEVLAK